MSNFDRDMQDELQAHIDHRADDLVRSGLTRDEAMRRARVEFGALEGYKEQLREGRSPAFWRMLPVTLLHETRIAVRRLRQAPLFVAFAIASLAIGLGVTTAAYSVMQAIVWPDIGVAETDRVALVAAQTRSLWWRSVMSLAEFDELRKQQGSFSSLAGSASKYFYLTDESIALGARGEVVTGNYFQTLGVAAAMGRTLQPADDDPAAPAVIVISNYLWRVKLGEDPHVIGRVIRVGDRPVEIVGVMPEEFGGLGRLNAARRTDVWASWTTSPVVDQLVVVNTAGSDTQSSRTSTTTQSMTVVGRLRQDAAIEAAAAEIATAGQRFDSMWPRYSETSTARTPAPRKWTAATLDDIRRRGLADTAIAAAIVMVFGLVLAVACTNLTNLTLARGAARETEVTVRRALGASRSRLVRELAIESLLVGVAGGVLALLTARWLITYVATGISLFGTTLAEMFDPRLDFTAYMFAAGAVVLAFVVIGLLPAIKLTRDERSASLARGTTTGGARWRGQRMLIRGQIAVSMLLMLTAAFCIAIVFRGTQQDTGLDLESLVIAQMGFAEQARDPVRAQAAADAVLRELAGDPMFERAAVTSGLPSASATFATAAPEDRIEQLRSSELFVLAVASPGLTDVLGIRLLHGRALDHRDSPASTPVAVISATLARELFGATDVVGRRIAIELHSQSLSRTSRTVAGKLATLSTVSGRAPGPDEPRANDVRILSIVGVTADTQVEWGRVDSGVIYVPLAQIYEPPARIVARRSEGASEQAALMALRNAVRRAGSDLAITSSGTGEQVLAPERAAMRVVSGLTSALGAFALALTMIGLYGVLSHVVVRRTRELCLRLTLGATPGQLLRMVIHDGLRPVISGAAIGVVIGIPIRIAAHDALDEFLTIEPLLFAGVTLGFVAFGAAACYWPARRAARVDANTALKEL